MNLEIDYINPVFEKHAQEASDKNLELLNRTEDRRYGYYKLPCGHFTFLNYGSVRRSNSFKCAPCTDKKFKDRVVGTGLEFVSKFEGNNEIPEVRWCDYGYYKHLSCGHVGLFIHKNAIKKKTSFCKECVELEYKELVETSGLLFKGFTRPTYDGTLYIDVQLPCGHSKTIQTGNFKIGVWKCQECWQAEFKSIAAEQGIEILSRTHGAYYSCKLPCGCVQEIFLSNIKSNSWNCHSCNETYYNKSSSIYLIKFITDEFEWLKLGFSKNVETRIENFKVSGNYSRDIVAVIDMPSGEKAVQVEKEIHKEFRKYRLDPLVMKGYHTRSGFTECYPVELLNKLEERLKEIST